MFAKKLWSKIKLWCQMNMLQKHFSTCTVHGFKLYLSLNATFMIVIVSAYFHRRLYFPTVPELNMFTLITCEGLNFWVISLISFALYAYRKSRIFKIIHLKVFLLRFEPFTISYNTVEKQNLIKAYTRTWTFTYIVSKRLFKKGNSLIERHC